MLVALKPNSWQALRAPSPFAGLETKCLREDQPPGVTHDWAVKLQERDEHLWRLPIHRGGCPNRVSSCHLLGNTAPDLGSWWADVAIPVWCSHSLPGSCLSPSLLCQLLSQVFLVRNVHPSLQTRLCTLKSPQCEKRAALSGIQNLLLPLLGAFRSLPRAWFVEWLRFPPQRVALMAGCAATSPHLAERAVEASAGGQHHLFLCLLYSKSLHESSSRFTFPWTASAPSGW